MMTRQHIVSELMHKGSQMADIVADQTTDSYIPDSYIAGYAAAWVHAMDYAISLIDTDTPVQGTISAVKGGAAG